MSKTYIISLKQFLHQEDNQCHLFQKFTQSLESHLIGEIQKEFVEPLILAKQNEGASYYSAIISTYWSLFLDNMFFHHLRNLTQGYETSLIDSKFTVLFGVNENSLESIQKDMCTISDDGFASASNIIEFVEQNNDNLIIASITSQEHYNCVKQAIYERLSIDLDNNSKILRSYKSFELYEIDPVSIVNRVVLELRTSGSESDIISMYPDVHKGGLIYDNISFEDIELLGC